MIERGVFAEKKYELIEGILVEKRSESELHVWLFSKTPEPDLAIIEGDWKAISEPTTAKLVIEVAGTSLPEDRAKAACYAQAGTLDTGSSNPKTEAQKSSEGRRKGSIPNKKSLKPSPRSIQLQSPDSRFNWPKRLPTSHLKAAKARRRFHRQSFLKRNPLQKKDCSAFPAPRWSKARDQDRESLHRVG